MKKSIKVSPNFTLREFAVSADHPDLAQQIQFTENEFARIQLWCYIYGEPIRAHFGGKPVIITSGKRSPALNEAVGGSTNSDHMMNRQSCAVDFWIPNGPTPEEIAEFIRTELRYWKQLGIYRQKNFIHLSLPDHTLRRCEEFNGDLQ